MTAEQRMVLRERALSAKKSTSAGAAFYAEVTPEAVIWLLEYVEGKEEKIDPYELPREEQSRG